MILSIISLILSLIGLYLHITISNVLALIVLMVFIISLYGFGAIIGLVSFIRSFTIKFKPFNFMLSLCSIIISVYGLIVIL